MQNRTANIHNVYETIHAQKMSGKKTTRHYIKTNNTYIIYISVYVAYHSRNDAKPWY